MSKNKPIAAKAATPSKPEPRAATAKAVLAKRPAAKAASSVAAAVAAKPVAAKPMAVVAKTAQDAPKPAKTTKLRQKPVRDSFTMPESDFALIASLKSRLLAARRETKKSELLRAGLHVLAGLDMKALTAALGRLDPVKIGRPKKSH